MRRQFGAQAINALEVMHCESGGDPSRLNNNAASGDYSVGLFQINLLGDLAKSRPSESWLRIPLNNIAYAATMQKQQTWVPWSCARNNGIK